MIRLENSQNKVLSRGIKDISPIQYESIQVKNKLLDGTFHIQTIGDPLKYIEFEILSNHDQVDLINKAEHQGEPLKLILDSKYYKCLLEEKPDWQRITMRYKESKNRYYTAKIRLNINEEGIV